jgi:hypothetical protein
MSVPVQDSPPDLADKPASGPPEPEQTELANGVRADVHPGWLTGPPTYPGGLLRSAPDRTDLHASARAGEGDAQLVIAFFAQPRMAGRLVRGKVVSDDV